MQNEFTLAELHAKSGVSARTIRSWVAQGLLPGPSRGPFARYPAETLDRVRAIRAMSVVLLWPLEKIRRELLVLTPEDLQALADKVQDLPPESETAAASDASSALDYVRSLREQAVPAMAQTPPAELRSISMTGFEALEYRLGGGRAMAPRRARGEEWLRMPITPDVELAVRGPLDDTARARLERCADLIRNILLGRDR